MADPYGTLFHRLHHGAALLAFSGVLTLLGVSLVAASARPARPALALLADARSLVVTSTPRPKTCVYSPTRKFVGCIVRTGKTSWDGNVGAFISIELTKKGAYMIYENATWLNFAFASPRGQRHRYAAHSGEVFTWVSATRWNVVRRGRLVAFTRGQDGVPAALAFATSPTTLVP